MTDPSVFHEGERRVQARLGVRAIERFAEKAIRPFLPDQHRVFYGRLPFLVAAARDAEGRPWVTLLAGEPGFVRSPDERTLAIEARPGAGDPLQRAFVTGADLGLLGIELSTRRRNRVNGRIVSHDDEGFVFAVDQSFGNCPKYIRERAWQPGPVAEPLHVKRSDALDPDQRRRIAEADTFFIASGHRGEGEAATFGMDASHRGGAAGFVRVDGGGRIVFPDYSGNHFFNTIGNLMVDPRVGVTFVDFGTGSLLQITGRATIDWDSPAVAATPGAGRLVEIEVDAVVERRGALPLRWRDASAGEAAAR